MSDDATITIRGERPGSGSQASAPVPGLLVLFSEGEIPGDGLCSLRGEITIGRAPDQRLFIQDQAMSRQHARIITTGGALVLRDLGSHNGTFVDGLRVTGETTLSFSSVVRCGSSILLPVEDLNAFRGWPGSALVPPILGGPAIREIVRSVEFLAGQDVEILLTGESGTGKELLATLIHERSGRAGPLVPVNCAAVPEALFEAELFGARKGAFTGATADRSGLMMEAQGGTFFLDEIGELPLALQPKLLRVLEQRQVRPLGSSRAVDIDIRVVAATNRDLTQEVANGRFREDLYHRLCGIKLHIPALAERVYDIVLLTEQLLAHKPVLVEEVPVELTAEFVEGLLLHRWPGNVRELRRVVHEAQLMAAMASSPRLEAVHFKPERVSAAGEASSCASASASTSAEAAQIQAALRAAGGNLIQAAVELQISRSKLYRLLKKHGLKAGDFRSS